MRIGLHGISAAEAQAARRARTTIGLVRANDALVLVLRIDGLTTVDLPYDHRLVPADLRGMPDRPTDRRTGYAAALIVVDTATGIVAAARMISVTPTFADALDRHLADLEARASSPDWAYDADLAKLYAQHPRSDDLFATAEIVEVMGQPF